MIAKAGSFGQSISDNVTRILNGRQLQPLLRGSSAFRHFKNQRQRKGVAKINQIAISATMTASSLENAILTNSIEVSAPTTDSKVNFGGRRVAFNFANADMSGLPTLLKECDGPDKPRCFRNNKFRTLDGSCNNLRQPKYGQANTPMQRILPNAYDDGVFVPRSLGLPSAREVSNGIAVKSTRKSSQFSSLFMSFGQFLDHDLTHVPVAKDKNERGIQCCDNNLSSSSTPEESLLCFPIRISASDPFHRGRKDCINVVRSVAGPSLDCQPGPHQQLNQVTHWIDASHIYGSSIEEATKLRRLKNGLLRVQRNPDGSEMLPDNGEPECRGASQRCFLAGDLRVNEQPNLALLHTVFVRQHNRVARQLRRINPRWSDNDLKLFQETRRLVTAQWQHIVYNEFLPLLLGQRFMTSFNLYPLTSGFSNDYSSEFDPRISNAFATAAFRVGHTMIPRFVRVSEKLSDGRLRHRTRRLRDIFNDMDTLRGRGALADMIRGMLIEPAEKVDNVFVDDILNHLFEDGNSGLDLVALNIQRGRDHGLPAYVEYRRLCQVGIARSFDDLRTNISPQNIEKLRQVYSRVEDIDLFAGMSLEKPSGETGSPIGDTFLCLIGDQFAKLKKGDRYFYDLAGQSGSFTQNQLDEIRKTSLSRIICDNVQDIDQIQPLALKVSGNNDNPLVKCSNTFSIPRTSLEPWRES